MCLYKHKQAAGAIMELEPPQGQSISNRLHRCGYGERRRRDIQEKMKPELSYYEHPMWQLFYPCGPLADGNCPLRVKRPIFEVAGREVDEIDKKKEKKLPMPRKMMRKEACSEKSRELESCAEMPLEMQDAVVMIAFLSIYLTIQENKSRPIA